jgi:hypothetical protein
MRNGAIVGATRGAITGFATGEIFGGEITFGTSGVAGAALGSFIQGTIGTMNGVATGSYAALSCYFAGAYDHN